jgi:hypothetical protein
MLCRRALTTRGVERGRASSAALIKFARMNDLEPCRRELSQQLDVFHRESDKGVEPDTRAFGGRVSLMKKRERWAGVSLKEKHTLAQRSRS